MPDLRCLRYHQVISLITRLEVDCAQTRVLGPKDDMSAIHINYVGGGLETTYVCS